MSIQTRNCNSDTIFNGVEQRHTHLNEPKRDVDGDERVGHGGPDA